MRCRGRACQTRGTAETLAPSYSWLGKFRPLVSQWVKRLYPQPLGPLGSPGQVDVEMEGCKPGAGRAAHSVRVWPPTGEASRGATGPPAPGRGSGLCSLILASSLVPGWPRVPLPCPRGHGLRSEAAALGSRAAGVGVAVTAECGRQTGRSEA